MGTIRREVIIERPADEVWARVGDPANTPTWFPGMVDAQVEGKIRTITTAAGLSLPEEIVTIDPILRRFQYRVTAPLFKYHLGTIDVFDLGDGRSLVSYSTDCEPDAMALIIGGAAGSALDELRRQLESSEEHRRGPSGPARSAMSGD
jgi:hypothetical protein